MFLPALIRRLPPAQVCLYFHNKLYRGNRVTKVDTGSFNAFSSPNLAPLANAEVDITSEQPKSQKTFSNPER